jgi:LysM repeat protein
MSGDNPPGRALAWAETHKPQAAAAAAGAGVLAYALWKRRQDAAAGDAGTAVAATDGNPLNTAGIASPDTSATDDANDFQTELSALQSEIDSGLANPVAPTAPKPAEPALPKNIKTIVRKTGDTLAKIAKRVYGTDAPWAINELKKANPDLKTFSPNDPLNFFAGHVVNAPKASIKANEPRNQPGYKPAPKKPAPKKPAPKKPAPSRRRRQPVTG